jgi:hypothetical protein
MLVLYIVVCSFEYSHVGFEVLTAVVKRSALFRDITACSLLKASRRFGEHRFHRQGQISRARYQSEKRVTCQS